MDRPRPPRIVPLLALAVALLGVAGALVDAAVDGPPTRGATAVVADTADTGGTGEREVVGELGHLADVVSSVPASPDGVRGALRHAAPVLAVAGAGLAALAARRAPAVDTGHAAVPSAATAHVRRRGPPLGRRVI